MESSHYWDQIAIGKVVSTIENFSAGKYQNLSCPNPSLAEQCSIADYLDRETARIDALITKKQRMIELLQARTESLIAANLDPKIARWGEAPLKSVANLAVSNVDKKSYDGQVPVRLCNYTDVYYNRRVTSQLDFMEATADAQQVQRLTLRAGDVLITKDSETADDIAVPALVQENLPGVVLGYHLALLRPTSVSGAFLYWAIRSRRCRDAFSLAASGVTRVGLRQDAMGRVPIPAVPSAMQSDVTDAIEREVGLAEDVVRKSSAQTNLLRERRQALITAAVTGELEVSGVAA
jgi:type I restriction enzyme S subunit